MLGRPGPAPRCNPIAAARDRKSLPMSAARPRSDVSRPRNEYGAMVVFAALFWLQSRNTLPARRLLVIVAVTSVGMLCSSCWATRRASTAAPLLLTGSASGAYRCSPLLPLVSGYTVSPMSSISSRTAWATSHSCGMVTPSPGSRSNTRRVGRTGLSSRRETPLRHMHFQRRLLGDPRQSGRAVDDRVRGAARTVRQRPAVQPVRRRTGELLFEERRLLHTVGPPFAGGRPAGDVRQHDLGDGGVVAEDVRLGGAGGGIEHLVGVGQRDAGTFRRARRPSRHSPSKRITRCYRGPVTRMFAARPAVSVLAALIGCGRPGLPPIREGPGALPAAGDETPMNNGAGTRRRSQGYMDSAPGANFPTCRSG